MKIKTIVNLLKKWHFGRKQSHADTGDQWQLLIEPVVKMTETMGNQSTSTGS